MGGWCIVASRHGASARKTSSRGTHACSHLGLQLGYEAKMRIISRCVGSPFYLCFCGWRIDIEIGSALHSNESATIKQSNTAIPAIPIDRSNRFGNGSKHAWHAPLEARSISIANAAFN